MVPIFCRALQSSLQDFAVVWVWPFCVPLIGNRLTIDTLQGKRADKKLARGEVPPLVLKIEGVVGPETAFAFLKLCLTS